MVANLVRFRKCKELRETRVMSGAFDVAARGSGASNRLTVN